MDTAKILMCLFAMSVPTSEQFQNVTEVNMDITDEQSSGNPKSEPPSITQATTYPLIQDNTSRVDAASEHMGTTEHGSSMLTGTLDSMDVEENNERVINDNMAGNESTECHNDTTTMGNGTNAKPDDGLHGTAENQAAGNGSIDRGLLSKDDYKLSRFILLQITAPIICLIGIIGNSVGLVGLHRQPMKYAFGTYLTALTSVDIVLLAAMFVKTILVTVARAKQNMLAVEIYAEFYLGLLLGSTVYRVSGTLISIISVERFISVAWPFRVKMLALEKQPKRIIATAIVLQVILQLPTFYMYKVEELKRADTNETIYIIAKRDDTDAAEIIRRIHLIAITVVGLLLPLLTVALSTVGIISYLKHRSLNTSLKSSMLHLQKEKERERMNATLVAMSIAFTTCTLFITVIYMLSAFNATFKATESYLMSVMVDANTVLICINSADDFLIYFIASSRFRKWFVHTKRRCCRSGQLSGDDVQEVTDITTNASGETQPSTHSSERLTMNENNCSHELFKIY